MTQNQTQLATQSTQPLSPSSQVNFFDPNQFATVQRMATLFAASALVPDTYQSAKVGKEQAIANCVIALDIATRIGASPLMVMQNLVIIYGRPSWSSKFLIATVNSCGRFEPLKFRFTEKGKLGKFNYTEYVKTWVPGANGKSFPKNEAKTVEFDGTKIPDIECVAYTTAKGSTEVLESSPVTIRMAIEEGWYTKNGSKWRTMPEQMLMYRCASFWTSVYAPELSMGMHTVEETQDIIDVTDTAVDVTEQVEQEKAANANGEVIGFDDTPEDTTQEETTQQATEYQPMEEKVNSPETDNAPEGPAYSL